MVILLGVLCRNGRIKRFLSETLISLYWSCNPPSLMPMWRISWVRVEIQYVFHLMITESLMILREETVVLFKRPTRPNIFLQVNLDSLTTCDHPYWNTYIILIGVMREHDLDYTFLKIQHIFYQITHISVINGHLRVRLFLYNLQGEN